MYINRVDAGHQLAQVLRRFQNEDAVVLALPRGGVVLGAVVARELKMPLGLVLVRKIGHPAYSEYAIGAVAEDEEIVYNHDEINGVDKEWLHKEELAARQAINYRRSIYFGDGYKPPVIKDKMAIIVDDGIATGLTMQAAIKAVKSQHPKKIIVAVPVASEKSVWEIKDMVDEVIVMSDPEEFKGAVGAHYHKFNQISDEDVIMFLREVKYGVS